MTHGSISPLEAMTIMPLAQDLRTLPGATAVSTMVRQELSMASEIPQTPRL